MLLIGLFRGVFGMVIANVAWDGNRSVPNDLARERNGTSLQRHERRLDTTTLNQWVPGSPKLAVEDLPAEKAHFHPVFPDREGGSCVSAHRSRLLGRFWGACLRRQKSRSRR